MGNRTNLLDWFRRGSAKAAAWVLKKSLGERTFSNLIGPFGTGSIAGGWSGNRIEQVNHYKHWVYRAIGVIQTLATKEPPQVVAVRSSSERKRHERKRLIAKQHGKRILQRPWLSIGEKRKALGTRPNEELDQLPDNHRLVSLLQNPNQPDTGGDLWRELVMFLELTGNSYLWKVPSKNSPGVAELWVMPAHWVWPICLGKSGRLVDYYEVRPWGQSASSQAMKFDPDELIHFQHKSPLSKWDGMGPLQAGAEIIDTYESVQLSRFAALKNGANIGTVMQIDAGYDPDDDDIRRFEAKWFQRFQGEFGFERPMMLPPGATLIPPMGDRELAMISSADQMRDYVFGMWGLAKTVAGFTDAVNRATFDGALAQAYFLVVNPRLSHIGEVLTEKLCPDFGNNLRVYWPDMSPEDEQSALSKWTLGLQQGVVTGNEFRNWMNLEPMDGLDEPRVPMSHAPMSFGENDFPGFGGNDAD